MKLFYRQKISGDAINLTKHATQYVSTHLEQDFLSKTDFLLVVKTLSPNKTSLLNFYSIEDTSNWKSMYK